MNRDRIIESEVPGSSDNSRMDVYLARRFGYLSRTAWQKEILSGRILLNGSASTNTGKRVRAGDLVRYCAGEIDEPAVDPGFGIIMEDENYIAVNKTGNLPVHPSGIFFRNTLLMLLEESRGVKFYPVHRLDRETSGAVIFAKSPVAASLLQKNFGGFRKEYIVVVRGEFPVSGLTVDMPLGQARNSSIQKKREAYPEAGEHALTRFSHIISSGGVSVVKAIPLTGRMHQIRAHLQYAGYPILGDKMYGLDESIYLDYIMHGSTDDIIVRAGFHRCALHSEIIGYDDPFSKRPVEIQAFLPHDMRSLISSYGAVPGQTE